MFHAGLYLLLSTVTNKYWSTNGKNLAKNVAKKRIKCFKFILRAFNPFMGELLEARVTDSTPLAMTVINYAGAFLIKKILKGAVVKFQMPLFAYLYVLL